MAKELETEYLAGNISITGIVALVGAHSRMHFAGTGEAAAPAAEVERLRAAVLRYEEREAAVCPEDVSFEEVIRAQASTIAGLREALAPCYAKLAEAYIEIAALNGKIPEVEAILRRAERALSSAPAAQTGRSDWERELFALTPGGSEFVGDAKRCAEFVRERLDAPFRKKAAALTSQSPMPAPSLEHATDWLNDQRFVKNEDGRGWRSISTGKVLTLGEILVAYVSALSAGAQAKEANRG
jgi:hypothetical protein